jgi:hypothetical protein
MCQTHANERRELAGVPAGERVWCEGFGYGTVRPGGSLGGEIPVMFDLDRESGRELSRGIKGTTRVVWLRPGLEPESVNSRPLGPCNLSATVPGDRVRVRGFGPGTVVGEAHPDYGRGEWLGVRFDGEPEARFFPRETAVELVALAGTREAEPEPSAMGIRSLLSGVYLIRHAKTGAVLAAFEAEHITAIQARESYIRRHGAEVTERSLAEITIDHCPIIGTESAKLYLG